jgi:hypothetical protein
MNSPLDRRHFAALAGELIEGAQISLGGRYERIRISAFRSE